MFDLDNLIKNVEPYSYSKEKKKQLYVAMLSQLTQFHYEKCDSYRKILDIMKYNPDSVKNIEDIPFIPVRLFKDYELLSVDRSRIIKTITSSGTTGQRVSKIFLDRVTSTCQSRVLTQISSSFVGHKRLPMLIIDTSAVIKSRNLFSARGAGILGFSILGYDITYALNEDMNINIEIIKSFLNKHKGKQILLLGFTFMIWKHFYQELNKNNITLPIENGILIHGGGWKKLIEQSVDNETFKKSIKDVCGVSRIYNYYGMAEQTGSIFMECEYGHLHASIFSDILVRDYKDFKSLEANKMGLIQLVSLLPQSYPGHSILTEDIGEILGEDDCPCGRLGKYFKVDGRIRNAEVRGCSDTYAQEK